MPAKKLYQSILTLLNFSETPSLEAIRAFLQHEGLCLDALILDDDKNTIYSLYTQEEVKTRKARGEYVSLPLSLAAEPEAESHPPTLLSDPAFYQERVLFPSTDDGAMLQQAFHSVVCWFRAFMLGCSAGVIDVATLNKYKSTRALILEFQQTKNTMNPVLSPVGWREDAKLYTSSVERAILSAWIYPFIFTATGEELSKIRRCRQCGTFFVGIRLSATFCTTKCRMAWNYAHRA